VDLVGVHRAFGQADHVDAVDLVEGRDKGAIQQVEI